MKDLITILMLAIGMMGAFLWLIIGTLPPFPIAMCIIALMCLQLLRGIAKCR